MRTLLKAFRLAIPPTGGVMSFDAAAAARALYEALAEGDYEGAAQRVTDDVLLLNVATGDVHHGPAGFLAYMRGWSTAIPDLKLEPLEIAGSGTRALAEYEIRGNHSGPLVTPGGHVPSTGMDVQISFCDVLELEGELVSRIRSYFDSGTLLRQLGLLGGSPLHAPDRRAPLELYAQTMDENAPERNKAIVSRYVQDVLNRQNPQAAVDTCSRDIIWHGGPLGTVKGMKEYQAVLSSFFAAFPDLEVEVLDLIAERDRVVVRFASSGTHLGEFKGIAPTFKRVIGGGMSTFRIDQSRIVEEWWQGDLLVTLQQMNPGTAKLRLSR